MLTVLNTVNKEKERNNLTQPKPAHEFIRGHESIITAVAIGGFFILVGAVFVTNPDLWENVTAFFQDITTRTWPFGGEGSTIALPAPANPAAHAVVYNALLQFDICMGVLQIVILALRVAWHSRTGKISETVGNMVFWIGAALLVNVFLLPGTLAGWWQYWAALIVVVGVSVIARGIVYLVKR